MLVILDHSYGSPLCLAFLKLQTFKTRNPEGPQKVELRRDLVALPYKKSDKQCEFLRPHQNGSQGSALALCRWGLRLVSPKFRLSEQFFLPLGVSFFPAGRNLSHGRWSYEFTLCCSNVRVALCRKASLRLENGRPLLQRVFPLTYYPGLRIYMNTLSHERTGLRKSISRSVDFWAAVANWSLHR